MDSQWAELECWPYNEVGADPNALSFISTIMTLTTRLLQVESDLLDAINASPAALESVTTHWTTLLEEVSSAISNSQLDEGTVVLAQTVAARMAILADSILDVHDTSVEIQSAFMQDVALLSDQWQFDFAPSQSRLSFVEVSYRWLSDNLHNPYPTDAIKSNIASTSATTVESINRWFIKARRRIGWTAYVKTCFAGCRSDAVQAARAVYCDDGINEDTVDPAIVCHLMQIRHNMESMYGSKFQKGELVESLSTVVRDSAVGGATRERKRFRNTPKRGVQLPNPLSRYRTPIVAYPSPAASTDELPDDFHELPRSQKRRAISTQSSVASFTSTSSDERSSERLRYVASSSGN
jgi:hypothetical protein